MFSGKAITFIAAGAAVVAVAGGSYGIVNATTGSGTGTASAATGKVIPFQRGAPSAKTAVGQVPQGWTPGSGTIVAGTNASKAKAAAVAAYPGGTVDRVVLLANGDYNVHLIAVNWPHHVFVNADFTVMGAE